MLPPSRVAICNSKCFVSIEQRQCKHICVHDEKHATRTTCITKIELGYLSILRHKNKMYVINASSTLGGRILHIEICFCCRSYKELTSIWGAIRAIRIDLIERIICTLSRRRLLICVIKEVQFLFLSIWDWTIIILEEKRFTVTCIAIIMALLSSRFGVVTNVHRVWVWLLNEMTLVSTKDFNIINSTTSAQVAVLTNDTVKVLM